MDRAVTLQASGSFSAVTDVLERNNHLVPQTTSKNTEFDLISAITSRQSVSPKRLSFPAPSRCEIQQMVQAAASAPDHAYLQPCRFLEVPTDSRVALADIFISAKRRTAQSLDITTRNREMDKATSAPTLLAVYARLQYDHPRVTISEQLVSVGASIQNFLLAAHGLGYGSIILSGDRMRIPQLKAAFELEENDLLVGFISIGTPEATTKPVDRHINSNIFRVWEG